MVAAREGKEKRPDTTPASMRTGALKFSQSTSQGLTAFAVQQRNQSITRRRVGLSPVVVTTANSRLATRAAVI